MVSMTGKTEQPAMAGLRARWLAWLLMAAVTPAAAWDSTVLLWPTNLQIERGEQATGLWLENRGAQPARLQVRVFGWVQRDGENVYAEQSRVLATPPMLSIPPGRRQMVRLSLLGNVPAPADMPASEQAFRVLVDEIPAGAAPVPSGTGVRFQFRYSLPLFVHGPGVDDRAGDGPGEGGRSGDTAPALRWHLAEQGGQRWLQVENRGAVRARLTDVGFGAAGASDVSDGLLGYVLAGSQARWALPPGARPGPVLRASVNGAPPAPLPPRE